MTHEKFVYKHQIKNEYLSAQAIIGPILNSNSIAQKTNKILDKILPYQARAQFCQIFRSFFGHLRFTVLYLEAQCAFEFNNFEFVISYDTIYLHFIQIFPYEHALQLKYGFLKKSFSYECTFVIAFGSIWLRLNYYTPKMLGHR